jgi:hypothetical protein
MAQIPNKKHVRVTITGAAAANYLIPDSGHYTKFTFSVPANVNTVGTIEGSLGGGFLVIQTLSVTNDGANPPATITSRVDLPALTAGKIGDLKIQAPCPGGLRLAGWGTNDVGGEPNSTIVDVMMTGSLYSSGRNS